MNSNVLVNTIPFQYTINESKSGSGTVEVTGLMQVAGDLNGNGRVYPKEILERAISDFKNTFIKGGNAFGELDHPESPIVSLKNVSHIVKDLWWEGDNVLGRVEILNTPFGNIVKEILKAGYKIGISSRGTGSTTDLGDGRVKVNDDFTLVTWDFVSNPSVQGAFMSPTGTLSESKVVQNRFFELNHILNSILRN